MWLKGNLNPKREKVAKGNLNPKREIWHPTGCVAKKGNLNPKREIWAKGNLNPKREIWLKGNLTRASIKSLRQRYQT